MQFLVQKFGGSSVKDAEHLRRVAGRILKAQSEGKSPVVVVSAQGDTTDLLLGKAREVTNKPNQRELDMLLATGEQAAAALLAMTIQTLGGRAVSLTGAQVGIQTDPHYGRAKILSINEERIERELAAGNAVIVCGFQGINERHDITTLGRGGSDTTAVALAAALGADACEIYTDVDGVFSADPRLVPDARKLDRVSYDEMLELAALGARVLHLRCVEIAKKYQVPIHVRSSYHEGLGTMIEEVSPVENGPVVTGVAHTTNTAKLTLLGVPDKPGIAAQLFGVLAEYGINVDMIIQSASRQDVNDISLTIAEDDLPTAMRAGEELAARIGAEGVESNPGVAKVSIVGAGMISHPGVAATMFATIADIGVNIEMISTSDISISCVVAQEDLDRVVRALHRVFIGER